MVKVSIIVPVYNTEKYIAKTLDSLIGQTLDSFEIVVVDDGSTDGSSAIIRQYEQKYPNLIHAYWKENGGLGSARNYGLQYARAEYIGFVDSDDWVNAEMYQSMYQKAVSESYDVVICDFISIFDGWQSGWHSKGYRGPGSRAEKKEYILYGLDPATACNKLWNKELFCKATFKEGWYEDVATTPILLSYANRIGYLSLPFYYYRQHDASITHKIRDERTLDIQAAWTRIINEINKQYQEEIVYAVYNSIVKFIYFKPEFADEFLQYAKAHSELFLNNRYVQRAIKNRELENIFDKKLIPKKIHYFWFGYGVKSELHQKCMDSWKKYAPDFEMIEWNESNCDINECDYVREAYAAGKWAFVADYFRIRKIFEGGGIYVDTDVEFMKDISQLRLQEAFFAFETKSCVNAAIFGAVEHHSFLKQWLSTYHGEHLVQKDGTLGTSKTIVVRLTELLKRKQLVLNGKEQELAENIKIYSPNKLTLDMYDGQCIAQHHYEASWWDAKAGVTSYKQEVLKDYFKNQDHEEDMILRLKEQNASLQMQLKQIRNSTCWKLTKPLRIIKHLIKK